VKRTHYYLGALFLAAVVVTPTVLVAEASAQDATVQVKVYDRDHKDYHNWDDHEDRAYRSYLGERHKDYREYNKQNHKEQKNYWNWRHNHPDHD
jgi:hypothetical protein